MIFKNIFKEILETDDNNDNNDDNNDNNDHNNDNNDDCGFPICDVEGLDGLYLYPQGYANDKNKMNMMKTK